MFLLISINIAHIDSFWTKDGFVNPEFATVQLIIVNDLLPEGDEGLYMTFQNQSGLIECPSGWDCVLTTTILDDEVVSVHDKNNRPELSSSPNPVSSIMTISNDPGIKEIQFFNLLGESIDIPFYTEYGEIKVNFENHPSGIYLMKYSYKGVTYSEKLVKE